MRHPILLATVLGGIPAALGTPCVFDSQLNVTYQGLDRNGIEVFLNIRYGQDTGGEARFKPPQAYVPAPGSVIAAQTYGPACPQQVGAASLPLSVTAVTEISEDCLNLNVARPRDVRAGDSLPVMVYIHGGGFWNGQNREAVIAPDGLVLQSEENGSPVIHVALNYRLGFFGFARSDALESEGSENAGLRDQRLAIEWVRDNIAYFGGDPEKITIFGQSSGGLAVGMQIMAYGASQPVPFQQAICESQALEPGITGNFTINAVQTLVNYVGCNNTDLHSVETVSCLRAFDMETLLNASLATYASDISHNVGDIWLPAVDGDFLPAAPSQLIQEGRFANVTAMIGWCEDDTALFTDTTITTAADTAVFLSSYLPSMTNTSLDAMLALYPVSKFSANPSANLSAEFYRTARIFRDIIMTCMPMGYGQAIANASVANQVYLYTWNQSVLGPQLEYVDGLKGLGVVHTSEFAYIFGNLSHYNNSGLPFDPSASDYALSMRAPRSWSTFASEGKPGTDGTDTFQGFDVAFSANDTRIFFIGGASEGLSAIDGAAAKDNVADQRLRERCAFLNSEEIIRQMAY